MGNRKNSVQRAAVIISLFFILLIVNSVFAQANESCSYILGDSEDADNKIMELSYELELLNKILYENTYHKFGGLSEREWKNLREKGVAPASYISYEYAKPCAVKDEPDCISDLTPIKNSYINTYIELFKNEVCSDTSLSEEEKNEFLSMSEELRENLLLSFEIEEELEDLNYELKSVENEIYNSRQRSLGIPEIVMSRYDAWKNYDEYLTVLNDRREGIPKLMGCLQQGVFLSQVHKAFYEKVEPEFNSNIYYVDAEKLRNLSCLGDWYEVLKPLTEIPTSSAEARATVAEDQYEKHKILRKIRNTLTDPIVLFLVKKENELLNKGILSDEEEARIAFELAREYQGPLTEAEENGLEMLIGFIEDGNDLSDIYNAFVKFDPYNFRTGDYEFNGELKFAFDKFKDLLKKASESTKKNDLPEDINNARVKVLDDILELYAIDDPEEWLGYDEGKVKQLIMILHYPRIIELITKKQSVTPNKLRQILKEEKNYKFEEEDNGFVSSKINRNYNLRALSLYSFIIQKYGIKPSNKNVEDTIVKSFLGAYYISKYRMPKYYTSGIYRCVNELVSVPTIIAIIGFTAIPAAIADIVGSSGIMVAGLTGNLLRSVIQQTSGILVTSYIGVTSGISLYNTVKHWDTLDYQDKIYSACMGAVSAFMLMNAVKSGLNIAKFIKAKKGMFKDAIKGYPKIKEKLKKVSGASDIKFGFDYQPGEANPYIIKFKLKYPDVAIIKGEVSAPSVKALELSTFITMNDFYSAFANNNIKLVRSYDVYKNPNPAVEIEPEVIGASYLKQGSKFKISKGDAVLGNLKIVDVKNPSRIIVIRDVGLLNLKDLAKYGSIASLTLAAWLGRTGGLLARSPVGAVQAYPPVVHGGGGGGVIAAFFGTVAAFGIAGYFAVRNARKSGGTKAIKITDNKVSVSKAGATSIEEYGLPFESGPFKSLMKVNYNGKGKIVIVSDIHGDFTTFNKILSDLRKGDILVINGDLIDRGDSVKTLYRLRDFVEEHNDINVIYNLGNHEYARFEGQSITPMDPRIKRKSLGIFLESLKKKYSNFHTPIMTVIDDYGGKKIFVAHAHLGLSEHWTSIGDIVWSDLYYSTKGKTARGDGSLHTFGDVANLMQRKGIDIFVRGHQHDILEKYSKGGALDVKTNDKEIITIHTTTVYSRVVPSYVVVNRKGVQIKHLGR